jgi:hypothetical protein
LNLHREGSRIVGRMPIRWHIDHAGRRVSATLLAPTSEEEMYDFLGEVVAEGAMPYSKLIHVSAAVRSIALSRIGPVAATARLYRRMGLGAVGPLAIVVSGKVGTRQTEELSSTSEPVGLVRLFGREDDAELWLQTWAQAD